MTQLNEIGIEFKSGILFSVTALVFSVVAGIAGGVSAGIILLRCILFALVFFAVGTGIIVILKKFVPELYDFISSIRQGEPDGKTLVDHENEEYNFDEDSAGSESGFTEFTENDYDRIKSVPEPGLDGALDMPGDGKLGKHVIMEDQLNGYEPKLMAQAIRTMMSKDKD